MIPLLSSSALRSTLADLMRPDAERIIAVGFIGSDPLAWIANPAGIDIYCWNKPGSTSPAGIEALIKAGARVHFVPNLHTKVYWNRNRGVLLGSANLSEK